MSTALTSSNPPEVFISYSNEDKKLLKKLEVYLKVLHDQEIITLLDSHRTVPGIDFAKEIEKNLSIARIILLLVSVDFLASPYCRAESERAMERHKLEATFVIPVILRPCDWLNAPFGKLQALPKDGEPIVLWSNRDEAFLSVTEWVKKVADIVRPPRISTVKKIEIKLDDLGDGYDQNGLEQRLRVHVAVDLKRITISIQSGSIKIVIEGNSEELDRIVNALRDPKLRKKILRTTNLQSIGYVKDEQLHSIAVGSASLIDILKAAIRGFPAVKYLLVLAIIAAAVTVVAGLSRDLKVAFFGPLTMLVLILGLVRFAFSVIVSKRQPALILTWTWGILITVISLCIFTGFFVGRGPLQAYLYPGPNPSPAPSPRPTAEPSPSPTITTGEPKIVVTERPPYDRIGGPASKALITGRVSGVRPHDYRIVIYSLTDRWYVQPTTINPKLQLAPDGSWSADIHRGTKYAILLVPPDFQPPATTSLSPTRMSGVITSEEIQGVK